MRAVARIQAGAMIVEAPTQTPLVGRDFDELADLIQSLGEAPYRARQIYQGLYRDQVGTVSAISTLPLSLRESPGAGSRQRTAHYPFALHVDRWNGTLPPPPCGRTHCRSGLHSRIGSRHALHFQPSRLRGGLQVLPHGTDGAGTQPDRGGDRRASTGHIDGQGARRQA